MMNTIALGNQRLRRMRSAQINEFIPFAPLKESGAKPSLRSGTPLRLKESGAKPSLRSGTPLRDWVSTVCIHLMWIQTYIIRLLYMYVFVMRQQRAKHIFRGSRSRIQHVLQGICSV